MTSQLKMGIAVEHEHKSTVEYIQNFLSKHGHMPTKTDIYKHIAQNHLQQEDKNYYTKLKKA
jgi:sulfur relay (sulfurtransferase) DsrC/TusE family protein